jgi:hypothetical protein
VKINNDEPPYLYLSPDIITVSQNKQDDNGQGACRTCDVLEIKFWLENLKMTRDTLETQA